MWAYIVRRLAQSVFILLLITGAIFALTRLSADPMAQYSTVQRMTEADRQRIREKLGLDAPLPVQYLRWLGLALQGELGQSLFSKAAVSTLIMQRLPMTLVLMFTAEVVIITLSVTLAVVSAVKQYSWVDNVITSFSFVGFSMPVFFIGLSLMFIFAVHFKKWGLPYLPTGADIWDFWDLRELAWHLVLPVATLTIIQVAGYSRYLRSSLLEVLGQDYVRTGRAKGLAERQVLFKHALRNAALPFVTIVGLDIPFLLGGAIVTESVYSWPGMGRLFWEYAQRGDFPVVMGVLLLVSTAVVFFTILTDVIYTVVDPRIRLS
jgi:peptide/nickel transport system permease protein